MSDQRRVEDEFFRGRAHRPGPGERERAAGHLATARAHVQKAREQVAERPRGEGERLTKDEFVDYAMETLNERMLVPGIGTTRAIVETVYELMFDENYSAAFPDRGGPDDPRGDTAALLKARRTA